MNRLRHFIQILHAHSYGNAENASKNTQWRTADILKIQIEIPRRASAMAFEISSANMVRGQTDVLQCFWPLVWFPTKFKVPTGRHIWKPFWRMRTAFCAAISLPVWTGWNVWPWQRFALSECFQVSTCSYCDVILKVIGAVALMIQSYLVTEDDNKRLNSDKYVFDWLVSILDTAVCGEPWHKRKFTIIEVIEVK